MSHDTQAGPAWNAPDRLRHAGERAQRLVEQMSLEEKIDYLGGSDGFYIRAVPRLGIPAVRMADGPIGVRNDGPAPAYPATVGLAASWDRDLAGRIGDSLGRDALAKGVQVLLGPGVNIHRVPQCGRNFEYMGEDPILAGELAVAYIQGVQRRGVVATVKHFVANNQEYGRQYMDSVVGERALQEIYFPAFRRAVQEGGVAAVMNGYNRINGRHCSEDARLLSDTLRGEWGFEGFVMSDWVSVYDPEAAVRSGLDLEMPDGAQLNRRNLLPLIRAGRVSEEEIDVHVYRILRTIIAMGPADSASGADAESAGQAPAEPVANAESAKISRDNSDSDAVALEAARRSVVLLKNGAAGGTSSADAPLLPLTSGAGKTVAIVGPNAHPAVSGGGGSSFTEPFHATSLLEGLQQVAPKTSFVYVPTLTEGRMSPSTGNMPVHTRRSPHSILETEPVTGFYGEYFVGADLRGAPAMARVDERIDFRWDTGMDFFHKAGAPLPQLALMSFSARWRGTLVPATAGSYQLALEAQGGVRLWLDGEILIDDWEGAESFHDVHVELEAEREYELQIDYQRRGMRSSVRFAGVRIPWERIAGADAVVAAVGFNAAVEGEANDRSFALPAEQERLLTELLERNSRTAVVLNAGGAVDARGWIDRVPALLHGWYGGQEGGRALAELLFGLQNPGGKLPITWERDPADGAAYGTYPGTWSRVEYREDIFVGYRHADSRGTEPLFPFGHGLSYTRFEYRDLRVDHRAAVDEGEGSIEVSCGIENSGERAGREVVQLYVATPGAAAARPVQELKDFDTVALSPGESAKLSFSIPDASLAYYDTETKSWKLESGTHEIRIGASSRDIRLTAAVEL